MQTGHRPRPTNTKRSTCTCRRPLAGTRPSASGPPPPSVRGTAVGDGRAVGTRRWRGFGKGQRATTTAITAITTMDKVRMYRTKPLHQLLGPFLVRNPFYGKCVVLEPRFWLGIGSLNKYLCICPNLDDGGQRDNISSSKCEARNDVGGLGAAREARKEAKREKQRAKKLVRAAKSLVPPRWMEKSRSAHEGVALSKGAHSFRWGINRIKSI